MTDIRTTNYYAITGERSIESFADGTAREVLRDGGVPVFSVNPREIPLFVRDIFAQKTDNPLVVPLDYEAIVSSFLDNELDRTNVDENGNTVLDAEKNVLTPDGQFLTKKGQPISLYGVLNAITDMTDVPLVVLCDITDTQHTAALAGNIVDRIVYFESLQGNIVDPASVKLRAALHSMAFAPGRVIKSVRGMSAADITKTMNISVFSLGWLADALAPIMSDDSSIVYLSFGGDLTWDGYRLMNVAKRALEALAGVLAIEYGPLGISFHGVAPGAHKTLSSSGIPGFGPMDEAHRRATVKHTFDVVCAAVFVFMKTVRGGTGGVYQADGGVSHLAVSAADVDAYNAHAAEAVA